MNYYTAILNNGIRLIHIPTKSAVSYCGFIINTGTRDELENESGIAHLTEHMLFKGTKRRKAFHVLSRLDDVGGELDAFTTKEDITIYAAFLNQYYERSIELFADIIFNSTFPDKELSKEIDVIYDEINSYKDNPAEFIYDEFEALLYRNHSLGNPILGNKKSIKRIKSSDIQVFVKRCFNTDEMVFCSVGNIEFKKLQILCNKCFGVFPENKRNYKRKLFSTNGSFTETKKMRLYQAHCIIGNSAYSYKDEKRLAFLLLTNLLAGAGMNSRLNLLLREKHGITYNIEASYIPYLETGNFSLYFGTDISNLEKSIELIHKDLLKLCNQELGSLQLSKAKKQIIGQMAISAENHANLLLSVGKSFLIFDDIEDVNKIYAKINQITAKDIMEVANEICYPDKLSTLVFK